MSKGNSGLFHGTLGTTYINGSNSETSYSDRGIEIPEHIKHALSKLKKAGDTVTGKRDSFTMQDVSIMSKEAGVEFARVTIGDEMYLIRGDKSGAVIPDRIISKMVSNGGTFDFHSHPHNDDCIPSPEDRQVMTELKRLTGQATSQIVTPNGRTVTYDRYGVIEVGIVSNVIDHGMQEMYKKLFGGK